MALTKQQDHALVVIYMVTSSISLIADCLVILGYIKFKALRKLAFTFVFCIACADTCRSLAQTWGNVGDASFICKFQGWLQTFGAVAMGLWFAIIALVCISIKKHSGWWKTKTHKDILTLQYKMIISVIVFSVICASIPWNQYAYGGGWCWISSNATGQILRYACYYGWLMLCLLISIIVYCELFRVLREETKMLEQEEADEAPETGRAPSVSHSSPGSAPSTLDTNKRRKKMFDIMKAYPWALIIGQGPGALRRVIELISGNPAPFILVVIHAVCSGLFGCITAVIYGTKTWQIYKSQLVTMCNTSENDMVMENTQENTVISTSQND
eukprot:177603_1